MFEEVNWEERYDMESAVNCRQKTLVITIEFSLGIEFESEFEFSHGYPVLCAYIVGDWCGMH